MIRMKSHEVTHHTEVSNCGKTQVVLCVSPKLYPSSGESLFSAVVQGDSVSDGPQSVM